MERKLVIANFPHQECLSDTSASINGDKFRVV